MSASAKPVEKVLKSLLAVVLAVSFCPLIPAEKAQAQETGDSNEPAVSAQVADEGGVEAADPDTESPALAVEGDSSGDDGIALQADDSGTPIVEWTASGTCRWMIDASGCLTIKPANGKSGRLENWESRRAEPWNNNLPWGKFTNEITSVKIEKGVIAQTVLGMFQNCSKAKFIDLSGLDTSEVTNMGSMFAGCSSLASLDLSSLNTANVKYMGYEYGEEAGREKRSGMFYGCSSLKELDLSTFDTSNVEVMNGMFSSCSSLESIRFPKDLNTSKTKYMGCMFSGCSSLKELDLSKFDTSNVEKMNGLYDGMFEGCSSLEELDLSSFDTSRISSMQHMFFGCSSLRSLTLSGSFSTEQVTKTDSMFKDCARLDDISFPSSFDVANVSWMNDMFSGCLRLQTLDLSMFNTASATNMGNMFNNCQSLKSIILPSSFNTSRVTDFYNMFSGCRSLESLDASKIDTSSATSLSSMFSGCSKLDSLDVSGFKTSGNINICSLFSGCSTLRTLDLSGFDTSNITSQYGLSSLLSGCESLRTVTLGPKFAFEGAGIDRQCSLPTPSGDGLTGRWVSSADGVAYAPNSIPSNTKATYTAQTTESLEGWNQAGGCVWRVDDEGRLTVKPLPGTETGQLGEWWGSDTPWKSQTSAIKSVVIEKGVIAGQCLDYMFYGCSNLVSADLSGISTSNTASMAAMFSGCSSLTSLNLVSFDTSSVTKMDSMFRDCTSLESLNVSSFDTSKVTSMLAMFNSCSSLKSLDLSSFDTSSVTTMMVMFGNCPSMKTLTLSSRFDTSSVESMDKMFAGCTALTALDVSGFNTSKVKTMRYMFSNCKSLTSLDVTGFNTSEVVEDPNPQYPSVGIDGMFYNCSSLTSLNVSSFDTSKVTNLSNMFAGCSSLVSLDLSGFDTSNVTDMSDMFQGCEKLESLDLSNFDTSNVKTMDYMFRNCLSIHFLNLSSFNTSNVTYMSKMFYGCSSIGSLNLGNFSTAAVSDMSSMFDGCTSLESLDISHFDTSSASNISSMFWNCTSLQSVALGDKFSFNGSKEARQCALPKLKGDGLTGLWENAKTHEAYAEDEVPNNVAATYTAQVKGETPKIAIDESMFTVDTAAKTYTGSPIKPSVSPGTLSTLKEGTDYDVSYGENVNAGEGTVVITGKGNYSGQVTCTFRIDPKQVDAPKAAAELVYSGEEQVGVVPSDEFAVAGGSATNAGDYTAVVSLKDKKNYIWSGKDSSNDLKVPWSIAKATPSYDAPTSVNATEGQTLGDLKLPDGFSWQDDLSTGVGDAGEHSFMAMFTPSDADNYKVVENIPVTVNVSKDADGWNAIGDCVWKVDDQGCLVIKPANGVSGTLPKWEGYSGTPEGNWWEGSVPPWIDGPHEQGTLQSTIRTARFEGEVKASESSLAMMFFACTNLVSVDLGGLDSSDCIDAHGMFLECSNLKEIKGLGALDLSKVEHASAVFSECASLESTDVSGFTGSNLESVYGMFRNCYDLKEIKGLGELRASAASDFHSMFEGCSSLESLDLSGLDTRKATNMDDMFLACAMPSEVKLGENFSFCGAKSARLCSLPVNGWPCTEKWVDVATGKVYGNNEVPDKTAATYRPQYNLVDSNFRVDVSSAVYSGEAVVGRVSSDSLKEGIDYGVTYSDNVNAGTAAIAITGKGFYAGTLNYTFRINSATITAEMISGIPAKAESGDSQIAPEPTVAFNGKTLEKGKDYTVTYGENKEPGKGTVTVAAVEGGNFTGSATVEFVIEKKAEPDPGTGGGGTDPAPTPDPGTGGSSGGGGDAPAPAPVPQQFAVTYHLDGGVNATSNPATYAAGTAVALADPTKEGFEFQGWYADAALTKRVIEIAADSAGDVELWAKWRKKEEQKPAPVFSDVDYLSWYGKAVTYVAGKGLITGYSGTSLFGVGDTLTRAQLATILWRNACPDEAASYDPALAKDETGIAGSADGQYYTAAANWAVKNGVISGFVRENGTKDFAADETVNFEQLVTILARLCATPEELAAAGSDLSAFADGGDASDWSRSAFAWAAGKGLVEGYDTPSGKLLAPTEDVARERVAVVLMRAFEMGILK